MKDSDVEGGSDSDDEEMAMYVRRFRRFIKKNKLWKKNKNQYRKDEPKKEYKKEFKKDSRKCDQREKTSFRIFVKVSKDNLFFALLNK